jgi:hypothetical protein
VGRGPPTSENANLAKAHILYCLLKSLLTKPLAEHLDASLRGNTV